MTHLAVTGQSADPSTPSDVTPAVLDLANPQMFDLGQGRQRITKADFFDPNAGIKNSMKKSDDPLSGIDPLWSLGAGLL